MSYLHIQDLYKSQELLIFRECFALEKVHGTSAHVSWLTNPDTLKPVLTFFSGGESHPRFVGLFDQEALAAAFAALGHPNVVVYGEAYGGACMRMKETYGPELRFIAFDVQIGDSWLSVPDMEQVAQGLGIEVVPWRKVPADIESLNAERDRPSEVAVRRGCGDSRAREGIVLRPLIELTKNNGERLIAKHKSDTFAERSTPPKVVDSEKLKVLAEADATAQEWVTEMRLTHVLDKMPGADIKQTGAVIRAMVEDVYREAKGEIVESKDAQAAIGKRAAMLFKERLRGAFK